MPPTSPSSTTDSPAASSPDAHSRARTCAIHQPNLFPRLSTLAKLYAADTWIVLDDVQFARRDHQHRTRLAPLQDADRWRWLSIPTHLPHGRRTAIRDAHIVDPARARNRTESMLRQEYGTSRHWPTLRSALDPVWPAFDTGRTAVVAEASTRALLNLLGWRGRVVKASTFPTHPGRSRRLADLTQAAGADIYLCGTGGMTYLDPTPFTSQALTVIPFLPPPTGTHPQARQVTALWTLAHLGPTALATRLDHGPRFGRPANSGGLRS
ncbi:WbqC family protein [Streptomyces sp. NPDC014861]|uniref:WbqC family protein n=1 Tax=Streptomyces sp. NPDC014861 TaxID=3364923 RepID=UPI0036F5CB1A